MDEFCHRCVVDTLTEYRYQELKFSPLLTLELQDIVRPPIDFQTNSWEWKQHISCSKRISMIAKKTSKWLNFLIWGAIWFSYLSIFCHAYIFPPLCYYIWFDGRLSIICYKFATIPVHLLSFLSYFHIAVFSFIIISLLSIFLLFSYFLFSFCLSMYLFFFK